VIILGYCISELHALIRFKFNPVFMAARQLSGRRPLRFAADVSLFLFSPSNLGGCFADRHQTLPHVRRGALKMLDVKLTDQCAGHEIAGHENDGLNDRT